MPAQPQSTPAAGAQNDPVDLRASIYQGLIGRGLTPQQAMGVVYSMMGESGTGLDPNSLGDSGISLGFGQWNGSRRAALEGIAKSMGTVPTDPSAQLKHFFAEIDGPEKAALEQVRQATSAADATRLWTGGYERPKVNNWQARFAEGSQAGRIDPKTGGPVWTAGPAATVPAGVGATTGATPAAPATSGAQDFAAAAQAGNVGGALAALTKGKGEEGGGKGPLGTLGDQLNKAAPAPQASQMLQSAPDEQGARAQAGQALLGQVLQQGAKPLTWSSQPYGYGVAGPQIPGTTINSIG